jgi:hypothetical protein
VNGLGHGFSIDLVGTTLLARPGGARRRVFSRTNSFIAFSSPSIVIGYMRCEKMRRMIVVDSE